jgi:hypothetical protein
MPDGTVRERGLFSFLPAIIESAETPPGRPACLMLFEPHEGGKLCLFTARFPQVATDASARPLRPFSAS